jgi:hypothetical protein
VSKVYADGMEIACKASSGKSAAAFPDVCFTPPTAPPTPPGVPLPYPNTGMASDTAGGSKTVQIEGKEVMLKDKSYFKKSTGSEAGNAPKKGVISSQNCGKVYFNSWSMDVKFEGENVVRHLDMTTHNHASAPGNTGPWPFLAGMSPPRPPKDDKCTLRPYKDGCEGDKTPHHCVPDHCFKEKGPAGTYYSGGIPHAEGLCICVEGATKSTGVKGKRVRKRRMSDQKHYAALAEHGRIHKLFDQIERVLGDAGSPKNSAKLGDLEDAAAKSIAVVTGCDEKDLKKQLRDHHAKNGLEPDKKLRADPFGKRANPPMEDMGTTMESGLF